MPLDTIPILRSVATFLAGTAALVRPMMDHALAHLEAAAAAIQRLEPMLRSAHLDDFELCLRRALLIMYDEPDQWRIRALRIVMSQLMAACLPLILQSPRWPGGYAQLWGVLRVRVVVDHKWLVSAGRCPASQVILAGFEHMDVLWVKYRGEGWRPPDDLMFPERESADLSDPPPVPLSPLPLPHSSPLTSAAGKKKSRAIPIVRPDGTLASIPGKSQEVTTELEAAAGPGQPSLAETSTTSPINVEDPCATGPSAPGDISRPVMPDPRAPPGSAAWWAYISWQPHPLLFPARFFTHPQSRPSSPRSGPAGNLFPGPLLLGGPYFATETSIGEPSESATSENGSALGQSPTQEQHPAAAAPADATTDEQDALCSPTTRHTSESSAGADVDDQPPTCAGTSPDDHFAELYVGFGGPDDDLGLDQEATPHAASPKRRSRSTEQIPEQAGCGSAFPDQPDDHITP